MKWDYLDYMVVDTPPGTSDEHLSVTQLLHQTVGVNAVILVTTPQEVSLLDVKKQITFCRKMKLPIIGVVENMAYFRYYFLLFILPHLKCRKFAVPEVNILNKENFRGMGRDVMIVLNRDLSRIRNVIQIGL